MIAIEDTFADLERLQILFGYAESGERGFVITGDIDFLGEYKSATREIPSVLAKLRQSELPPTMLTRLTEASDAELKITSQTIEARRGSMETAVRIVASGADREAMGDVRSAIQALRQDIINGIGSQREEAAAVARRSYIATLVLISLSGILFARAYRITLKDASERASWTASVEQSARDVQFARDFVETLQVCIDATEVYEATAAFFKRLLPDASGELAMINNSRNLLEVKSRWGTRVSDGSMSYGPDQCHGLRCGVVYKRRPDSPKLACEHVQGGKETSYMCIPLSAQGESTGVLHLNFGPSAQEMDESLERRLLSMASHASMTLANIGLREKLKSQSIRDPLTKLFNRRYMEASLEREFARIQRRNASLAVAMIDLDHFKVLNDTYGHEAGDWVLQEVASVLTSSFRAEDIVCRYGGEELVVIIPEVEPDHVRSRLEAVAKRLRTLRIPHGSEVISTVTASFGYAVFPNDTSSHTDLIAKADHALYHAKHTGRDRIVSYREATQEGAVQPASTNKLSEGNLETSC